ncbi:MAG: prepilin-type N-terminal cleavage/methylation domain-containing protein [Planctomycetes bacterium]|nr:prepilin-type N-terminal cleavage/methylation domain-containing protein [Planctomycetota bacterium]
MNVPMRRRAAGFTLIELLVVMGILTGFLLMLAQLVDGGLRLFGEGELGQALADRASTAQRRVTAELSLLRGAGSQRDAAQVVDRLVVQELPLGLPQRPERGISKAQVLRGAVRLPPDRELPLLDAKIAVELLRDDPKLTGEELDKRIRAERQGMPLRGHGNLLLLPWRQEGSDEALLELRAAWLLPGQFVPVGSDRFVDPFDVPLPGSPDLPGLAVWTLTQPLVGDLLHVEFQLWAQNTRQWVGDDGRTGGGVALRCWDSARGGWLVDAAAGGAFPLDRGPSSAADARDDVHPHALLCRIVVAQPAEYAPEGLLAVDLAVDDTVLRLYDGDRFPGPAGGGWVKIRTEWIAYAERSGDELRGLRRGLRNTSAKDHAAGARVHVGRNVEFVVPVLHAKDDWNG